VVTDGIWQSAFITTGKGVIVLDAPESYAAKLPEAISAVTKEPVRVLIYTHAHKDHIGGSAAFSKVDGLRIIALKSLKDFLVKKNDPNRLVPTETFSDAKILELGNKRLELKNSRNYHSDEGDLMVYLPNERFLMAIDTLAPGYVPFMGFDITSNFHEYMKVFDDILAYDFDVFVGGHLTQLGTRKDVEETKEYVLDVYRTTKKVHGSTYMMAVFAETAKASGSWDNKYLLFRAFLEKVTDDSAKEIVARWSKRLAGVDVFVHSHVMTALLYVRWDD
jgi:glyoxylase-like metal-dependent hydrolase (beta-lactamase superfamily II)